jgi:hypothetical protein
MKYNTCIFCGYRYPIKRNEFNVHELRFHIRRHIKNNESIPLDQVMESFRVTNGKSYLRNDSIRERTVKRIE